MIKGPTFECFDPAPSVTMTLAVAVRATVIVTEDGSIAYFGLFAQDATRMIIGIDSASYGKIREYHLLLSLVHLQVFYFRIGNWAELHDTLKVSLKMEQFSRQM